MVTYDNRINNEKPDLANWVVDFYSSPQVSYKKSKREKSLTAGHGNQGALSKNKSSNLNLVMPETITVVTINIPTISSALAMKKENNRDRRFRMAQSH